MNENIEHESNALFITLYFHLHLFEPLSPIEWHDDLDQRMNIPKRLVQKFSPNFRWAFELIHY